jgi:hypothetical protein
VSCLRCEQGSLHGDRLRIVQTKRIRARFLTGLFFWVFQIIRTLMVSPLCAVSVEAVASINAELRGGGPLVGRASQRVSLSVLKPDPGVQPRPSATAPERRRYLRPSALRFLITWEPVEEPSQTPCTHFPYESFLFILFRTEGKALRHAPIFA